MADVYERIYIYIKFAHIQTHIYRNLCGFPNTGTKFVNQNLQAPKHIQEPPTPQSSWHPAKILMIETAFPVSKGKSSYKA